MYRLLIEYDTIPFGKKGDIATVPNEISELLQDYYLFFSFIIQKERKNNIDYKKYEFVPVMKRGKIDFQLVKKEQYNKENKAYKKALEILNRFLYH